MNTFFFKIFNLLFFTASLFELITTQNRTGPITWVNEQFLKNCQDTGNFKINLNIKILYPFPVYKYTFM